MDPRLGRTLTLPRADDSISLSSKGEDWSLDILVGQPEGLPEGSRRPSGVWGRRPPGNSAGEVLHPGRGASIVAAEPARAWQAVARPGSVWHPSGVLGHPTRFSGGRSPFALNDHRLPAANPLGWLGLLAHVGFGHTHSSSFALLNPVRTRSTVSLTPLGMNGTRWNASLPSSGPGHLEKSPDQHPRRQHCLQA